ncbi:hypothetical protein J7E81_03995 [Bacillus sp. ISL-18]|uniref:hypothetical protein n=1 Tax=Bacillaceae TaxID=186817 RepID=UPI001BE60F90|nr:MULTISPECIES: hypothetical protein [Bacillaceae]MBT2654410.1 hypothetical protein [Bacillus sp. ISL-18]ULT58630.1 hypothetical protein L1999_08920 [Neobacillus drentensis]
MEPRQTGNKKMPDFDQLNDRIILESTPTPMIVIKTNLDPKNVTENNPYYQDEEVKDPKAVKDYFEE